MALTIDNDTMPYKVLLMRGTVHLDLVAGLPPEYEAAAVRVLGEAGGQGFLAQLRPICPRWARAFIKPTWVGIMDFESRFPIAIERAMEQAGGH